MSVPFTLDERKLRPEWDSGDFRRIAETAPGYYFTPPIQFPTEQVGYRKLRPFVRQYLKAIIDPVFRENHAMQWACYVVALGKLCDQHRETVTCPSMIKDLGTMEPKSGRPSRPLLFMQFIETWDSIAGPIPGVK